MNAENGKNQSSRWANRPCHLSSSRVANEDDLAMAALLGEANKRSEAQERESRPDRRPHPQNQNLNQRHVAIQSQNSGSLGNIREKRIVEDDGTAERDSKRGKTRRWSEREYAPQRRDETPSAINNDATSDDAAAAVENPNKVKANFGLSGALASDIQTGNVHNGVTLKFSEPPEARIPNTRWRLYVFRRKSPDSSSLDPSKKDDGLLDTYHISRQSSYLFGRERKVADIPVDHPSLSKQHAVLQFRALPSKHPQTGASDKLQCKPYLMDLESTNGTFINGVRLESARYYELRRGDVITLGASSREYVLLTEQSAKTGI